ncbi:MAG: DAK2 domain-containing protein [Candidatus Eremiobacteraeota bacterium]|nr:DAK2 domain-containing protein [Candidatus Eremiobacteraeota bacterium]
MPPVTTCDGETFTDFLIGGSFFLRKYRGLINALNVFPVPDGDTGTNMFYTLRRAMLAARKARTPHLGVAAQAAAQGALMGARGNSGVILAQMLSGFAGCVADHRAIGTAQLPAALQAAMIAARSALADPVEGTMLSVGTAAAEAAAECAPREPDFVQALEAINSAADAAVERTRGQLAALAEAGVVDAGGQGLAYMLEGALRMPAGMGRQTAFRLRAPVTSAFNSRQHVEANRFCTHFVLRNCTASAEALRTLLGPYGESLIVAGNDELAHVHLHTDSPELVARLADAHGRVEDFKSEDMQEQHGSLVGAQDWSSTGVVAVVPGEGFASICKELGADATVITAPGAKPSVQDLLAAVKRVRAQTVYLLTNDRNVVLAARAAERLCDRELIVVPTESIADGIAVLMAVRNKARELPALNGTAQRQSAAQLVDSLLEARAGVAASARIFGAGRDATIGGVSVLRRQLVGELDARNGGPRRLVTGADALQIALNCIESVPADQAELVTLYYGGGVAADDAERVAAQLRRVRPGLTVEVYYGGQPAVDYVLSIER